MRRTNRLVLLGALAFAGSVAGHAVAYFVSHPDAHERSAALMRTGHGAFGELVAAATAAALVALVGLALRAGSHEAVRFTWLSVRLVPLQLAIFIALELAERSFDPRGTFEDPVVLAGLIAQVLVALGTALLARGAERVVRSIAGTARLATERALARQPRPVSPASPPCTPWRRGEAKRRAPPLPHPA